MLRAFDAVHRRAKDFGRYALYEDGLRGLVPDVFTRQYFAASS